MADEILTNTAGTTDTTGTGTTDTAVTLTPAQQDLLNIKTAIAQLKTAGEALFADEITALEAKAAVIEATLKAEVETVVQEIETVEQSFVSKYGSGTAHGLEIVALIAILAKLFGAI